LPATPLTATDREMTVRSGRWSRNIQESSSKCIPHFLTLKISQFASFEVREMMKIMTGEPNVKRAAQEIPCLQQIWWHHIRISPKYNRMQS
jgi:hypothetical protein